MRAVTVAVSIVAGLVVAGCAGHKNAASKGSAAPGYHSSSTNSSLTVPPEEALNGKISWVNTNLRFVVITFPLGQMPAVDRRLNVYRRGLKVAEVKISGPQTEDSIVADVETGEVETGDTVSDR
jgi:hypothetical protein